MRTISTCPCCSVSTTAMPVLLDAWFRYWREASIPAAPIKRRSPRHTAMLDVSVAELASLAVMAIAGGIVTGLLAGFFGIGGGAVIVPVLYESFRIFGVPDAVRMQ